MHVAFTVDGVEREVDIDVGSGNGTVGDLLAVLTDAAEGGLTVDGRYWDASTPLTDVIFRQGAVLSPASGPSPDADVSGDVVSLSLAGGPQSGHVVPLPAGTHVLGRDPGAAVSVDDETLSAQHVQLDVGADGRVVIADAGSKNGSAIEGYKIKGKVQLEPGNVVQAGAVLFRVGKPPAGDAPVLGRPRRNGTAAFNRPPRAIITNNPSTLRTPSAPKDPGTGMRMGMATLIAPVIFGVGTAAATGKMLMGAFALLSPVMMLANRMEEKRQAGKDRVRGGKEFADAMLSFRRALLQGRQAELARRREVYPDPAEVLRRATTPSVRLWERRPGHDDFLRASVGTATLAWTPPLDSSGEVPTEVGETVASLGWLPNAPLTCDLSPGRALGVVGDRAVAVALAQQVICQLAVHHGPADLRVAILTDPNHAADWDWAKWLPHVRSLDESSGRHLLAARPEEVGAVLDELGKAPEKPAGLLGGRNEAPAGPITLVVVDAPKLTEGRNSLARDVLAGEGVSACGLVLVPSADKLPALCTSVVELSGALGAARYREPAINLTIEDVLVHGLPEPLARQAARALSGLEDPEVPDLGADLPDGVALVDLIGGELTADALAQRWKAGGKIPRMVGPIGVAGDGPVEIDWVQDGPHALVAGTTGSGKSEMLRSVVAGLAASLDPEHLNFVLVDYKGGSAFAQCAGLPHTVGMVTDLDEHLGARALRCLEAELHYRETRLRDAGASDLKQYLQDGHPDPLPRLLVIIDEFATMAAELPDFIDSLVGIAQRGRSLGVHMILATQRPGGAVNDNIRANTNLRVSLRVQEAGESTDIIGTPMAAQIGRRQAGRGYLRLGASDVFPFQAALVTGVTTQNDSTSIALSRFVFGPDPLVKDGSPETKPAAPEGPSDLERLVAAAAEAARVAGFREARRPWPEELPSGVTLAELAGEAGGEQAAVVGSGAPFALADEPDRQRRALFSWSPTAGNLFACGVSGAGATDALATLAISLASTYGPERLWIYGLDFGTQALAPLAGLPHCGGILGTSDRDRQFRLVRHLAEELDRRRRVIATSGAAKIDPADPNSPFPTIVALIDNYGALQSSWDDVTASTVRDILARTIADGPGLGVVSVMSADRPLALPSNVSSVTPNKLALRLAEPGDLSFFGFNPKEVGKLGPGRAMDAGTKLEVQIATAHADGLPAAVAEVVAAVGEVDASVRPPAIGALPADVPASLICESLRLEDTEWFLPLGVGDVTLGPTGLRLLESEHAFVIGPPRSGKSTVLDALASVVGKARPDVVITAISMRRSPVLDAPEVKHTVRTPEELKDAVARIKADPAPQLVLVDDADALADDYEGTMAGLVTTTRSDVHLVVAARPDPIRSDYGHWTLKVRQARQGLALRPNLDQDANLLGTMFPRGGPTSFDPGRGYLVAEGQPQLFQAAHRD